MDKNTQQLIRISIIFPSADLTGIVDVEKNLKAALSVLPAYRWDLQILERKGDIADGVLGHKNIDP